MMDSNQYTDRQREESTRINALEKETARLKTLSRKQSAKYNRMKKSFIFVMLFVVVLFIMMLAYGIIQWPDDKTAPAASSLSQPKAIQAPVMEVDSDSIVVNDAHLTAVGAEDMLSFYVPSDGIIFSVQIGAYTGVDLTPFETNLYSLQQYSYQDIKQLTAGIFQEYTNAVKFKDMLVLMGFHDAFIIATLNGKRIPTQEALAIKSVGSSQQFVNEQ